MSAAKDFILTIWLCLFNFSYLSAGDINYFFRHLTVEDGLAHTDAISVIQDDQGFIWIGTNGGLQRFDGNNLVLFWNGESQLGAVYNNRIKQVIKGHKGKLWIATEGGLKQFDTGLNAFRKIIPAGEEDAKILSQPCLNVFAGEEGELFLLNESGLYRFELVDDQVKKYNALYTTDLRQIYTGDMIGINGDLWVAYSKGIIYVSRENRQKRNGGINVEMLDQRGQGQRLYQALVALDSNTLIVGCKKGFVELDLQQDMHQDRVRSTFYPIPKGLFNHAATSPAITKIAKTGSNALWMGSTEGLIFAEKKAGKYTFEGFQKSEFNKNSLTSNHISSLCIDYSDNLWISTFSGGVNYIDLNQKQFSILNRDPGGNGNTLTENFVRAITMDQSGWLWLGTWSKGVSRYNPKEGIYTEFSKKSGHLSEDRIRSLAIDGQQRVWIGLNQGLNIYDPQNRRFHWLSEENSDLSGSSFFALDVDYFGSVWAGSWDSKGLYKIVYKNRQSFKIEVFTMEKYGLCSDKITFIHADRNSPEIFVGTNKGLNHILLDRQGRVKDIYQYKGYENDPTSLSSNFVWPIVRTNDTTLWVGTLGGGLNRVIIRGNGQYQARHFGPEHGAPSNDIESLEVDQGGNLWLGSKGLSMFNTATLKFTNYDYNDGLQGNSFKIGSSFTSVDGTMYFGGINGVSYFHPDSIRKSEFLPNIAFTEFYVNNRRIIPGEIYDGKVILEKNINLSPGVDLTHHQNDFTISFASLQYSNPQKLKYRYKLEGFDQDWNVTDKQGQNSASYLNLDYGVYRFVVAGSNHDGIWGEKEASLIITIHPPFWSTRIAKFLYGLIAVMVLFLAFYMQRRWLKLKKDLDFTLLEEQKMEELHQMRLKFFTNISHEFKTPLTLIISPIEKLISRKVAPDEQGKLHKIIYNNAGRLQSLINELMDFRKVETGSLQLKVTNGDIRTVFSHILTGFDDLSERKGIRFKTKIALGHVSDFWFDQGVVEKIVLNLMSNAFKYTKAGSITIEANTDPAILDTNLANHYSVRSSETDCKYLYIKVSDTGIGITKASISNIFDRYYRIFDGDGKHLGSGVGLALVKSMVLLHKGNIIVNSERRVGSEFVVCLPLCRTAYSEAEVIEPGEVERIDHVITVEEEIPNLTPEVSSNSHQTDDDEALPKVLLVEDNKELLSFLKDCFAVKYRTLEAYNGEEGWQAVHEHSPDIIISDIMMPVMDGLTFCETLKSDINYSHIPFILLTAKSGDESRIHGTELGADAYFSKPFNLTLLEKTVENILENRRMLKERYKNDTFVEEREMVSNKRDKEFMDRIIEIINTKIDDPAFDIDHLCMEVGNSRTKLYNKIKGLTGLSVGEFIRRMRMKKSAEIFLKEDVTVSEVMARVGIQSQSYFTKTFKKEFGITPAQYKNSMQTENTEL